ncbi:hypothetical protein COL5a_004601 [Colletotrichum fioriniae]|nr:hypothetical protein COL5a_004601 [Colletotrichum fioriniae]
MLSPKLQSMLLACILLPFAAGALFQRDWIVTWEVGAPNGQERQMIKINGQFPGPPIICDEDDDIEITVHNKMPFNTTVHWHGMIRKNDAPAPWHLISDTVADIDAMSRAVADPQILMISDWTRFMSWEYMEAEDSSGMTIFILVNGKGSLYCPGVDKLINLTSTYMKYGLYPRQGCVPSEGAKEIIEVDPEAEWVSLNFIGGATFKTIVFSIDEHEMWVYEVDGDYIVPQRVDTVHMYAGERYAVMIKLDKPAKDYTIRVADNGLTQVISAFATLRTVGLVVTTLDRDHLPPFPPNPPSRKADAMHVLHTHRWKVAWKYTMSGQGMYEEDRSAYEPLLYDPHSADAMDEGLVIRTKNGSWVDLVLQTHLAGGMAVAILDGIDAWPQIPPEYGPDQRGFLPDRMSPWRSA